MAIGPDDLSTSTTAANAMDLPRPQFGATEKPPNKPSFITLPFLGEDASLSLTDLVLELHEDFVERRALGASKNIIEYTYGASAKWDLPHANYSAAAHTMTPVLYNKFGKAFNVVKKFISAVYNLSLIHI